MNKNRVLFIAPSAYPLGGVQTWLDYLLPGLVKCGYDVVLGLTAGKFHDVAKYQDVHEFQPSIPISSITGSVQGRINAIEKIIDEINPDIVVTVNTPDAYKAVDNLRNRTHRKIRVIATLHGIHPGLIEDIDVNSKVIDAVVTTNKLTQKLVIDKTDLEPERVLYAPYGVVLRGGETVRTEPKEKFTVAYVGRLDEDQKRISDLIKIFSECLSKNAVIELLIAGDGPDSHMIENWVSNMDNLDRINFLGLVGPEHVSEQVYKKADALLLTSHWETGPIVAWEAMSEGVVLVSSRYVGLVEEGSLVHKENCLLFDIGDIQGATENILLATGAEMRRRLSENAIELISDKYTTERSVSAWSECLDTVFGWQPNQHASVEPLREDRSRLNTVFGQRIAEKLRMSFGIKFSHDSAGGEWPHTNSSLASNSSVLLDYVKDRNV